MNRFIWFYKANIKKPSTRSSRAFQFHPGFFSFWQISKWESYVVEVREGGPSLRWKSSKLHLCNSTFLGKTYFLLQALTYIDIEIEESCPHLCQFWLFDTSWQFLLGPAAVLDISTPIAIKVCTKEMFQQSLYGSKEEIDDQLRCFLVLGSATGKGESLGCMHLVGNPFKAHISHQMVNRRVCASPWSRWC